VLFRSVGFDDPVDLSAFGGGRSYGFEMFDQPRTEPTQVDETPSFGGPAPTPSYYDIPAETNEQPQTSSYYDAPVSTGGPDFSQAPPAPDFQIPTNSNSKFPALYAGPKGTARAGSIWAKVTELTYEIPESELLEAFKTKEEISHPSTPASPASTHSDASEGTSLSEGRKKGVNPAHAAVKDQVFWKFHRPHSDFITAIKNGDRTYFRNKGISEYGQIFKLIHGWANDPYYQTPSPHSVTSQEDGYILELLAIPDLILRSEILFFLEDMLSEIANLETVVEKVTNAISALEKKNESLDQFLQILLAHVNFFRVNTGGRPYAGLNLSSFGIKRFLTGRANPEKSTVLEFIVEDCLSHHKRMLEWVQDLESLAHVDGDFLDNFYGKMLPQICVVRRDLQRLLRGIQGTNLKDTSYPGLMTSACESLDKVVSKLETELAPRAKELCVKYGIDAAALANFRDWGSTADQNSDMQLTINALKQSHIFREPLDVLAIFELLSVFEELRVMWLQAYPQAKARFDKKNELKAQSEIEGHIKSHLAQAKEEAARREEYERNEHYSYYPTSSLTVPKQKNKLSVSHRRKAALHAYPAEGKDVLQELAHEDGYLENKSALESKLADGSLNDDDFCEEMEQVLVACLAKKRKIVSRIISGSIHKKDVAPSI